MTIFLQDKAEEEYLLIKEQNDSDVKRGLLWAVAPAALAGAAAVAFLPWQAWSIGAALSALYEHYKSNKESDKCERLGADLQILGNETENFFPETFKWVRESVKVGPAWDISKVVLLDDEEKNKIDKASFLPTGHVVLNMSCYREKEKSEPKFLFSLAHEFAHAKLETMKRKYVAKTISDFSYNASWSALAVSTFFFPVETSVFTAMWVGLFGSSLLSEGAFAATSRKVEYAADAMACVSLGMVDAGVLSFLKREEGGGDEDEHIERLLAIVAKEKEEKFPVKRMAYKLKRMSAVWNFKAAIALHSHPLDHDRVLSMLELDERLDKKGVWEGFPERERLRSSLLTIKKIQKAASKGKMSLG